MGLFGDRRKKKDRLTGLVTEVEREIKLSQELMQKQIAATGMDPNVVAQVEAAAMQPGSVQAMQAYGTRISRLYQGGVETTATLRSIEVSGNALAPGSAWAKLELMVQPPGKAAYEVITDQAMQPSMAQGLKPGQRVTVKVDPNDPQSLMIWAVASPAAGVPAQAPAEDWIDRLSKLQELRTSGVLTEEEFQVQKAKLLPG
jgi:hypothetical protein